MKILTNQPIQTKARWGNPGNKWKKERDLTLRGTFLWFTVAAGKESSGTLALSLSLSACLIFLLICFDASAKVLVQQQNKTLPNESTVVRAIPSFYIVSRYDGSMVLLQ